MTRGCLVCGCDAARLFTLGGKPVTPEPTPGAPAYEIRACENCGLRFLFPQPDAYALAKLYAEQYYNSADDLKQGYTDYTAQADNWRATFKRRLRYLPPTPARVLDVGAAAGFFVEQARAAGYDARGVEPSAWAATYAREQLGQPVDTGMLEAMRYPNAAFDVVTMWEVIEHVPDPAQFLAEVARILAPGGRLVFSTPDAGALASRLAGRRWLGWKRIPEHLWFFDAAALTTLLERAGFDVTERRYVDLTVSLDFFAERLGALLGIHIPIPRVLAKIPLNINPGYDLMMVAVKR